MTYRGKFLIAIVSAFVTFYAFSGIVAGPLVGWFETRAQQPINDPGAQIRIFESVLQHIQNDYVDEPDLEKVRSGALRGLAYGLDSYSSYLTAEQVKNFRVSATDDSIGIGAEFSQVRTLLYVVSVTKGSPADKSGLEAGDIIEYIGNKATGDISLYDATQLVKGKQGSSVRLRVIRAGEKPRTISVVRANYAVPAPTSSMKAGNIGVIKVYSFQKGQAEIVRGQIKALKDKGVQKIVLDLRNVAGGEIEEGVLLANAFIKDGDIAKVIGRSSKVAKTYSADAGKHLFDGEVVALIDFGSAGAAEVVASALLDRKRGEVVGERSFGAGTSQELFTLRGGDGLLLTTSKWASSTGKVFLSAKRSESGVNPSVEVKRPDTPEPIEVEELVEKREGENNQDPPATDLPKKDDKNKVKKPTRETDDLQMKKAIEILQGKAKAANG